MSGKNANSISSGDVGSKNSSSYSEGTLTMLEGLRKSAIKEKAFSMLPQACAERLAARQAEAGDAQRAGSGACRRCSQAERIDAERRAIASRPGERAGQRSQQCRGSGSAGVPFLHGARQRPHPLSAERAAPSRHGSGFD